VLAGSADVAAAIATSAFEPRAAAEKASKQQAAQKDGGVMAKLKFYAGTALDWCLENAMLVGATLCLGVLPLLLFCCLGGKKKEEEEAPAEQPSTTAAASSEPGPSSAGAADAAEDTPEKATGGKKAAGGKKRTPKTE